MQCFFVLCNMIFSSICFSGVLPNETLSALQMSSFRGYKYIFFVQVNKRHLLCPHFWLQSELIKTL